MNVNEQVPNPVVKTTKLSAYPGWVVRERADGIFDATNGRSLTVGVGSFIEAVAEIARQGGRSA